MMTFDSEDRISENMGDFDAPRFRWLTMPDILAVVP